MPPGAFLVLFYIYDFSTFLLACEHILPEIETNPVKSVPSILIQQSWCTRNWNIQYANKKKKSDQPKANDAADLISSEGDEKHSRMATARSL